MAVFETIEFGDWKKVPTLQIYSSYFQLGKVFPHIS